MQCYRCNETMIEDDDDHYRCARCRNILHVTTARYLRLLLALDVDDVVALAEERLTQMHRRAA